VLLVCWGRYKGRRGGAGAGGGGGGGGGQIPLFSRIFSLMHDGKKAYFLIHDSNAFIPSSIFLMSGSNTLI
jgi:hypothetical protein